MGLDINLNTSKIDISEEDGLNVDLYNDNIDISDDEADNIVIEITGLKSINKFIGLEDTPLYYDNGKFFKVEDNKIIYADIQWKDISGDISESPEIVAVISDLVNEVASDIVDERINLHNLNEEAHPYIQNIIEDNYTTLNNKINNIETEITQDISELENALNTEIENRENADNGLSDKIDSLDEDIQKETLARVENDTTLQNNINSVVSDLSNEISARESADTTLSNSISDLSDGLIQEITDRQTVDAGLQSQITSNYNTLDSKIDNVESSLSNNINDLSDTVDANDTAINNKVDNINNTLTNNISALSDTVSSNYTTLDNKIDSVNGALADSITALDNKYDNITSGLDDKIDDVDDTLTTHISDNSNPHNVTKTQVGLGNVDNTSDLNKPISTATQTALDGKVSNTRTVNNKPLLNDITLDYSDVNALPDTTTINDLTTTAQQNALNSGIDSTLTQQITTNQNNISNLSSTVSSNYTTLDNRITSEVNTLNGLISDEETARINADNGLQSQIDAITSASDVTDIVGTYAKLQAYDTTGLPDKSIIKVLQDESRNDETTYYRWVITNGTGAWVLIGEEGPYYTKSEADGKFVNQTTTVNNKALSSNITLTASDVNALPDTTVIGDGVLTLQKNGVNIDTFNANATANKSINITVPTDTADLTNGAGFITSASLPTVNNGTLDIQVNGTSVGTFTANQSGNTTANIVVPDSATWGNITGTLSNQIDLQNALDSKYDASNPDGYITLADLPTNYVTTDTAQDISGRKTFLGEKAIYFRQSTSTNKLGFTLYDTDNKEVGGLEYRPNTIDGKALLAINCPVSASPTAIGGNYVGFRYWGHVNIVAPRPTSGGTYFIPVKFTDGTNTVTSDNSGTLNISSLLPDVSDMATQTWVTNQGYTTNVGTVTSVNSIQPDTSGNVTITIPDTATWGNITGTLSNQTDLQDALDKKQDKLTAGENITIEEQEGEWTVPTRNLPSSEISIGDAYIAYGNGVYVYTYLDYNNYETYISTSINGETWTTPTIFDIIVTGLIYENNKFIALGSGGRLLYSTDGISWTSITIFDEEEYDNIETYCLAYCNNKFVVLSKDYGWVSTSTDGITWTTPVQNDNLQQIHCYKLISVNNTFIVYDFYDSRMSTSVDGINWTPEVSTTQELTPCVKYSDTEVLYINPYSGTYSIWTYDATNGFVNISTITDDNLTDFTAVSLCSVNGDFVAVSYSSDITRYYSSKNTIISATAPSLAWGSITGTLSNQTDLQNALNSKYDASNPDGYITSSDLPTNHVTTDTAQSISGQKTFTSTIKSSVNNSLALTQSTGEAFGVTVTRTDANNEIKFGIGTGGDNRGIWDVRHNKWAFNITDNGKAYALGNEIAVKSDLNSLSPLRYSRYSIASVNSTNKFIKLASMTYTGTGSGNSDFSYLFWVEILEANVNKCYALVKLSARWGGTRYVGHKFEILEKYGDLAGSLEAFKTLTYAYSLDTTTHKITVEIWLEIKNASWVSYYLRPTECNEYGDYSNKPITLSDNIWTYYNQSGNASSIASTAITSGLTQVKVTDATGVRNENDLSQVIKMWSGTKAQYDAITTKDANTLYNITDDSNPTLSMLELLYPVGSIYIGTMSACPLQTLGVGTWQLVATDKVLQGAGTRGSVGDTLNESLPNITGNASLSGVIKSSSTSPSTENFKTVGAMYATGQNLNDINTRTTDNSWFGSAYVGINASRSSSTYQDNAPVQQDAYLVNIWERVS